MFQDPTFWVLVAFIIFFALLGKPMVGMATAALDKRADKITADLDEAERLREEAQDLLASYQKKQRDAARDAEEIVAAAKEEAERIAKHGEERLTETLARREKQAMDRIGQAEANALEQVQAYAVEVAIDATRVVLEQQVSGAKADALITGAIDDLPGRLH